MVRNPYLLLFVLCMSQRSKLKRKIFLITENLPPIFCFWKKNIHSSCARLKPYGVLSPHLLAWSLLIDPCQHLLFRFSASNKEGGSLDKRSARVWSQTAVNMANKLKYRSTFAGGYPYGVLSSQDSLPKSIISNMLLLKNLNFVWIKKWKNCN